MLNYNSLIIFSENPKNLIEFYKKVFQTEPGWTGGDFSGFSVGSGFIVIGPHSEVKGKNSNPQRLQFTFETKEVEKEFERIKGIGATVIATPYSPSEENNDKMLLATLADPDGNFFQLATPMEAQK